MKDVRAQAARTLARLFQYNQSLSALLPEALEKVTAQDRGLLQELCYGSLRWFPRLNTYLNLLLDKPLKPRDSDIQALLLLGLYQLQYTRIPDHAAISATVEAAKILKKQWAAGLVNGLLRSYQRQRAELDQQLAADSVFQSAHPKWFLKTIKEHWPDQQEQIIAANNGHPPFCLRVNPDVVSRREALRILNSLHLDAAPTSFSDCGLTLANAVDVDRLPFFDQGGLSVQDEAAQLAANLLDLRPGLRVLDACCAPGGKTGHILEHQPQLAQLVALDSDPKRLGRVEDNLQRLQFQQPVPPHLVCGDATQPDQWWDGKLFDRILIDAPCSGTGVIRRHPDIKLLRKPADIDKLARLQKQILTALWDLLKPSGLLVYATCSIMPRENTLVVEEFLREHSDACCSPLNADWGLPQTCGRQLLPGVGGHDGFYYACLTKQ